MYRREKSAVRAWGRAGAHGPGRRSGVQCHVVMQGGHLCAGTVMCWSVWCVLVLDFASREGSASSNAQPRPIMIAAPGLDGLGGPGQSQQHAHYL